MHGDPANDLTKELTMQQAADLLQVSLQCLVRNILDKGEITFHGAGRNCRI